MLTHDWDFLCPRTLFSIFMHNFHTLAFLTNTMTDATDDKAHSAASKETSNDSTITKTTEEAADLKDATKLDASTTKSLAPKAEEPSHKKRRPSIQLNKDDHPEGECSDDPELNDEGEKRSDPFKRASEDVLKGRKIVKASRKWESASTGGGGGGVFGGVSLVASSNGSDIQKEQANTSKAVGDKKDNAPKSVFGSTAKVPTFGSTATSSGFGTFGSGFSAANGFGVLKSKAKDDKEDRKDPPKSTFGSGFGASAGFGAVQPASNGFGTKKEEDKTAAKVDSENSGTFTASTTTSEKVIMQSTGVTNNGEEDYECICEVRAKLFKLSPLEKSEEETEEDKGEKVASVPSTAGRLELKSTDEKKEEADKKSPSKVEMIWKEAGIGPVRILNPNQNLLNLKDDTDDKSKAHPRIVQRQESAPGSQGMGVILNANLFPDVCRVFRATEKMIKLDAPNPNKDSDRALLSYSLRVKTAAEADGVQKALEKLGFKFE